MLFLIILVISLILQFFLPWWIIAPVAFGAAFWKAETGKHAFVTGFLSIFTLWIVTGLFQSIPNEHILANRVGAMLKLPEASYNWLIVLIISAIIGGLLAGVAAMAGRHFREASLKRQTAH